MLWFLDTPDESSESERRKPVMERPRTRTARRDSGGCSRLTRSKTPSHWLVCLLLAVNGQLVDVWQPRFIRLDMPRCYRCSCSTTTGPFVAACRKWNCVSSFWPYCRKLTADSQQNSPSWSRSRDSGNRVLSQVRPSGFRFSRCT